jgi:hypothetical protein
MLNPRAGTAALAARTPTLTMASWRHWTFAQLTMSDRPPLAGMFNFHHCVLVAVEDIVIIIRPGPLGRCLEARLRVSIGGCQRLFLA